MATGAIRHTARHCVSTDEVEEVFSGYYYVNVTKKRRRLIIGETGEGRILEVPLVEKGKGRFYPVTAYDTRDKKAQLYLSVKAKKERG